MNFVIVHKHVLSLVDWPFQVANNLLLWLREFFLKKYNNLCVLSFLSYFLIILLLHFLALTSLQPFVLLRIY